MDYEQFLFTRNQRRDFTAFIRPEHMTNKEVSVLASAFNYINDVTVFTPEFPALYSFLLGAYWFALRHYDSGRKHAGREIGVIEGIAVPREQTDLFTRALPLILADASATLNPIASVPDIETIEVTPSARFEWNFPESTLEETIGEPEEMPAVDLIDAWMLNPTQRLTLPFDENGRTLLFIALNNDPWLDIRQIAFGSSGEVVDALAKHGIDIQLLGTRSTQTPFLKPVQRVVPAAPMPVSVPPGHPPAAKLQPEPTRQRRRPGLIGALVDLLLGRR
jgi:hypothetical protein